MLVHRIQLVRDRFDSHLLAAYNASGEYTDQGRGGERVGRRPRRGAETLAAITRTGADVIITYHAKKAAQWLK